MSDSEVTASTRRDAFLDVFKSLLATLQRANKPHYWSCPINKGGMKDPCDCGHETIIQDAQEVIEELEHTEPHAASGHYTQACPTCKEPPCHSDRYDAYFCMPCNTWLEQQCSDPTCSFCPPRPASPLQMRPLL